MSTKYTLDEVPTWKEMLQEETNLPEPATAPPENIIDPSKNEVLVNKVSFWCGFITKLEVDALVNSTTNTKLEAGGVGLNLAVHRAAGPELEEKCKALGGCNVGEAKIVGGFKLPAKYIILTVGPKGENAVKLKECYINSLKLAMEKKLKTIAFPCISTGHAGYPIEKAAHLAIYTVRKFLEEHGDQFERIIFWVSGSPEGNRNLYKQVMQTYFPL